MLKDPEARAFAEALLTVGTADVPRTDLRPLLEWVLARPPLNMLPPEAVCEHCGHWNNLDVRYRCRNRDCQRVLADSRVKEDDPFRDPVVMEVTKIADLIVNYFRQVYQRELEARDADVRAAAGELRVALDDMPPGSIARRLMIANRQLIGERDRLQGELSAARQSGATVARANAEHILSSQEYKALAASWRGKATALEEALQQAKTELAACAAARTQMGTEAQDKSIHHRAELRTLTDKVNQLEMEVAHRRACEVRANEQARALKHLLDLHREALRGALEVLHLIKQTNLTRWYEVALEAIPTLEAPEET